MTANIIQEQKEKTRMVVEQQVPIGCRASTLLTLKNERIFIFSEFTRLFFRNLTIMNLGISWSFSSDFRQIIRSTKIYSGMVGDLRDLRDLRAGVLCSGLPLHQRPVGAPDRWSQEWLRGWPQ